MAGSDLSMHVREFDFQKDSEALRECVMQLQDYEKRIDDRMPAGVDIVDDYIEQMHYKCRAFDGQIFVVDVGDAMQGYITVLARMRSENIEDGNYEYGLIDDAAVNEGYRGQGLGRRLLEAAEKFAVSKNAKWLRIGVLASNPVARELYVSTGFSELYIELEKELKPA